MRGGRRAPCPRPPRPWTTPFEFRDKAKAASAGNRVFGGALKAASAGNRVFGGALKAASAGNRVFGGIHVVEVAPAGFEPAISALRGLRPRPLDDGAATEL